MKKFWKKEESPKRSLEDILTPTSDDSNERLEESDNDNCVVQPKEEIELNGLVCFGWKEQKTDKWLIKCAKVWYAIMSFFWFLFGAMTFAPVIFISNKVNVIFKDKKIAFLVAMGIHLLIIVLVITLICVRISAKSSPMPTSDF